MVRLTEEKEALIRQLHAENKPVAAIARLVHLTRRTVYQHCEGVRQWVEQKVQQQGEEKGKEGSVEALARAVMGLRANKQSHWLGTLLVP